MKYKFEMESENFEQDIENLVNVFMNAYERYSKIKKEDNISEIQAELRSLDNRIDGLESAIKIGFKEVNTDKVYYSSEDYKETKKK